MATRKQVLGAVNTFSVSRYPTVANIVDASADKDSVQTLADMVGDNILNQIISGELPAGTPLTTSGLAQTLAVSRTPVAKALAKLAADGILVQPNNQNAVVSVEASSWLEQSRELRLILESEAAARAAGHIADEVLSDLWALSREAKPNKNFDWTPAAIFFDAALHLSIAEFCRNLPMKLAIRKCWTYKRLAYSIYPSSNGLLKTDYDQHMAILNAVTKGDSEQAWKAMNSHIQSAIRAHRRDRIVSK